MGRITEIKNIQKHRREVQRIAKEKGYSFPFHDFVKMINVFICMVIYNFFAFAMQFPIGIIADKINKNAAA